MRMENYGICSANKFITPVPPVIPTKRSARRNLRTLNCVDFSFSLRSTRNDKYGVGYADYFNPSACGHIHFAFLHFALCIYIN